MRGKRRTGECLTGILALCILFLSGCGQAKVPDSVTVPTTLISEKGSIRSYMISDFNKAFYEIEGLSSQVTEEVADFNEAHPTEGEEKAIVVDAVEMAEDGSDKAVVIMQFLNADMYQEYTNYDIFYGTVAQAQEKGYDFDGKLLNAKDNTEVLEASKLNELSKYHVIIAEEKTNVICPSKVEYFSEGAILNADGSVDISQVEGLAYLILK